MLERFEASLGARDRKRLAGLDSPARIQAFLDAASYSTENAYRSPLRVLRERRAHCYDGAVFAAAALRRLGHPPLVVDLLADDDDEHLLAVYKRDGHWGAVAKSNFAWLRFREPVHRSVRELVMSYFEGYFNLRRKKTLRAYTRPFDLASCDALDWLVDDAAIDTIAERLGQRRRIPLLTADMIARLTPVDGRSFRTGLLGVDPAGVYKPPRRRE